MSEPVVDDLLYILGLMPITFPANAAVENDVNRLLTNKAFYMNIGHESNTCPGYWGQLDFDSRQQELPPLQFSYDLSRLLIINNGHTLRVDYESGSFVELADKRFQLKEVHFCQQLRGVVHNSNYPMLLHLVHEDELQQTMVVSVFVQSGESNLQIKDLWKYMPKQAGIGHQCDDLLIDANYFLPLHCDDYQYIGELRTPPCDQHVKWYALSQPLTMSAQQIQQFLSLFDKTSPSMDNEQQLCLH